MRTPTHHATTAQRNIRDRTTTTCCITGGGPAGLILALLLARHGIAVTLLESHSDFDRDFRGDTIHPSTMELVRELGLADRLLQLPHTKIDTVTLPTKRGSMTIKPFQHVNTPYPYITFMPQERFLTLVAEEAQRYSNFRLIMGARVEELIEEQGIVRGVRYQGADGWHEVRAQLTVGADGRFSRLRKLAHFIAETTSAPMDVLWFRIPRQPTDGENAMAFFNQGHMAIMLNRDTAWQVAFLIIKGSYKAIHAAGLPALRQTIADVLPQYADRMSGLTDWQQIALLSVQSDRLRQWFKPGLLLIGDAAHVMSPVGGVGINNAIQDAVVAANVLREPLLTGRLTLWHLRSIQLRREIPTRVMQAFRAIAQRVVVQRALTSGRQMSVPAWINYFTKVPGVRSLPGRFLGYGVWPVHIQA